MKQSTTLSLLAILVTSCDQELQVAMDKAGDNHFEYLSQECLLAHIYESNGRPKVDACRPYFQSLRMIDLRPLDEPLCNACGSNELLLL